MTAQNAAQAQANNPDGVWGSIEWPNREMDGECVREVRGEQEDRKHFPCVGADMSKWFQERDCGEKGKKRGKGRGGANCD
jgi:hypothetical protein